MRSAPIFSAVLLGLLPASGLAGRNHIRVVQGPPNGAVQPVVEAAVAPPPNNAVVDAEHLPAPPPLPPPRRPKYHGDDRVADWPTDAAARRHGYAGQAEEKLGGAATPTDRASNYHSKFRGPYGDREHGDQEHGEWGYSTDGHSSSKYYPGPPPSTPKSGHGDRKASYYHPKSSDRPPPDSDYDFDDDNNEQDHGSDADGAKDTAPSPSMTAAPKESGSASYSQYGSESHSQYGSASYSQYGSESHPQNGSVSDSHYGSGSHSHNVSESYSQYGSKPHSHSHSQYGSVRHNDKHKKYKTEQATTLSTLSKHWGNATAYPTKSHSVTTTTTSIAITTAAELYSSMATATATAMATPAQTSMVFTGGLKDPTLDRPCFNSSCKNPDSNMNYAVTIPIGGSEPGAGSADNGGGGQEAFKGGAAGRVELAMGMGMWGALVAAGIAVAVVGL